MLGKRSSSIIGGLTKLLVSGSRSSLLDSPIDPFLRERSENSPNPSHNDQSNNNNSNRNFDLGQHGVGLGIVVALEKSSSSSSSSSSSGAGGGIGTCSKYFVCSPRGHGRSEPEDDPAEEEEEEEEEDYTYVTFHGPRVSFTMVYYDQIEKERSEVRDRDDDGRSDSNLQGFLCSCQRCGKKLNGQDIYMYRGEKGFCSAECRSTQIIMDDRSEQCRSEVAAADAWSYSSSSAYTEGQMFSTSILAV